MTVTAEGKHGQGGFGEIGVGRIHIGIDGTGLDVVDGDFASAKVAGEAFGEGGDGAFAHGVNRAADERHAFAVGAADIDDAATFAHMLRGFLGRDEQPANIYRHEFIKIFE